MRNKQIIDIQHVLLNHYVTKEDIAVDMTMGNGFDTLLLSGLAKFVYAFDIQQTALEITNKRLSEAGRNNYKLILESHDNVLNYVEKFKYVVYNLGYLPKGDKTITTTKKSTIRSLEMVLKGVLGGGIVFITVYPGHPEGLEESYALSDYFKTLDKEIYKIIKTDLPYQDNYPPYMFIIFKKRI